MNLGTVDRTPLMCQMSIGHMLMQLDVSPAEFWFDPNVFAEGLLQLRRQYDFDGILVSLHGHNPEWKKNVRSHRLAQEFEEVVWNNGDVTRCPFNDLPQHVPVVPHASRPFGEVGQADLPQRLDYIPVSQGLRFHINPSHVFDVLEEVVRKAGNEYSVHGEVTSPFDYFLDFFGTQDGLIGLIDDPGKSRMVLEHFARLVKGLAVEMCQTGIDAIKLSSPFAGSGFISPDFYAAFVLPFERQVIEAIRARGLHIYLHTCGAVGDRLNLMARSGASGLECLDPPPLGDVELDDAFAALQQKVFIKGNVDSVNTLLPGIRQDILDDARRRLLIGKNHRGYIFSTACSIAPAVKRESVHLLREAVETWG